MRRPLSPNQGGRLLLAALLLSFYLIGMGSLIRRVPGLDYSGCPVAPGPCDPLIVQPHATLGRTLMILAALVLIATVGLMARGSLRPRRSHVRWLGSHEGRVLAEIRLRAPALLLFLAAALVIGVAVEGVDLIVNSPVRCQGEGGPICPPATLPMILFASIGGMVVAVSLLLAWRTPEPRRIAPT